SYLSPFGDRHTADSDRIRRAFVQHLARRKNFSSGAADSKLPALLLSFQSSRRRRAIPAMNRFSNEEIAAVYKVITERRDIRHFLPDPISPELLTRLLTAAHLAPSVGFMQPWRFIRISDPDLRIAIHQMVEQE